MTDDYLNRALSRRRFLKLAGGGLAAAGIAPVLAACGGGSSDSGGGGDATAAADTGAAGGDTAAGGGGEISMWWWGEQEAIGIQKWVDSTLAQFTEQTGITVDPLLMDTDVVIPQFTEAAAAGDPPDVQFLFNGIYHMENVWLGYIQALNGLIPDETLAQSGATVLSVYQGKQYRVGWYIVGFGIEYDKQAFDTAGLDADSPPTTWDAFLDACDKIKSSGLTPFAAGVKNGFAGEWWFVNTLTQALDNPSQAIDLFIGELEWTTPQYYEQWSKLQELVENGFVNEDANSLDLYQGIALVDTGKAAMTINTTAALPDAQSKLGDRLGYMVMPVYGTGSMAGIPITDTQGYGIPADAKDPASAAKLLEFMHSQDRVNAMWTESKALPADEKFDASLIDDAFLKSVYETWWVGEHNAYVADLMPTLFWTDAMFVNCQKILAGEMTGEEAGQNAQDVSEKWVQQNPDLVENYKIWAGDLASA